MQGIRDRDEKLTAVKRVQLDADITRLKGNLASVPVQHTGTMQNVIAQLQRDLNELARKYCVPINGTQTNIPRIGQRNTSQNATGSGHATLRVV